GHRQEIALLGGGRRAERERGERRGKRESGAQEGLSETGHGSILLERAIRRVTLPDSRDTRHGGLLTIRRWFRLRIPVMRRVACAIARAAARPARSPRLGWRRA